MRIIEYFKEWTFDRYFRLAIAVLIGAYGIDTEQYGLLLGSGWFAFMAFSNVSCCGSGGCNTNAKQSPTEKNEEIITTYEEIK